MKAASAPLRSATASGLAELGERLRLARARRGLQADTLARAAGISRMTLFRIEKGAPSVALGAYAAVLEALDLQDTLWRVAEDDVHGRRLQDQELRPRAASPEVRSHSEQDLWAFKRRNQRRDLELVRQGHAAPGDMSWFTEERAGKASILGEAL